MLDKQVTIQIQFSNVKLGDAKDTLVTLYHDIKD